MGSGEADIRRFRAGDTDAVIALWERCELTRPWIDAPLEIALNQRTQPDGFHIAERHLAALGCPKVNLQVRHDNDAVVAFYERLGYVDDHVVSLGKRLPAGG